MVVNFFEMFCWILLKVINLDKKWILLYFRRYDDVVDEEGYIDRGIDLVLYFWDSVSYRFYI